MRPTYTALASILISLCIIHPNIGYTQSISKENLRANNTIKGKVTNENGDPLAGVTVSVKGTNISTSTDASGNYMLNTTDKQSVLVFSYIGLTTQEIQVCNQTAINFDLIEWNLK
jgi:hypothetical protein